VTPSAAAISPERLDVDDCESLVAVPLQQAADRVFAPAALLPAPPRLAVFGNVFFAGHRHPLDLVKTLGGQILKLNGFVNPYSQVKWIFSIKMAQ
jgi:hypothetical protein